MSNYKESDIAVVGIGCRFPGGASSPEKFSELIFNGIDAIGEVPKDRWRADKFYSSEHTPGKARTKWGGFIDQPHKFDASFFGLTPVEVSSMDPQQRLLLEVCWESMEDAGIDPYSQKGSSTGVFVGAFTLDHLVNETSHTNWDSLNAHTATGSMMTLLSNRISYLFDFNGPSMTLDTACSSSLIAVHLAVQAINNGECESAVAGGVNLMLNPGITVAESKANMLSPTGRSRSFDSLADGYVRGEGAGLVVLKPLAKAIADNDRIYAVIKGSATNQDGKSSGQTVPNGLAQQALVEIACKKANIHPSDIQYVEAHGTGTPVGDPIEANALGNVLSVGRNDHSECLIGSVKSNFGHTEAAAGIAGLIKTALCIHQAKLPKILHYQKNNPKIDFKALKLKPVTEAQTWPVTDRARLAGVNSFGFGGSNCHVILEQAPEVTESLQPASNSNNSLLKLVLTAKSEAALNALAQNYIVLLSKPNIDAAQVCANAALLRAKHEYRLVATGREANELIGQLNLRLNSEVSPNLSVGRILSLEKGESLTTTMVLSGMGPQWWAMGRELLESEPVFADMFDRCDQAFAKLTNDWSLRNEFTATEENSRMLETQIAQTSNFALQVSMAELYRSKGVLPNVLVGHSVGETAAAYISGSLSLEDAALVVYHRSRLQQTTKGSGGMLAVGLNYKQAQESIKPVSDKVAIAAINGPTAITLAGDTPALVDIAKTLEEQGIFQKFLRVEVPYHSPAMDHLKDEFLSSVEGIQPKPTYITLYSTVTGDIINGEDQTPEYWWRNLRDSVYFSDAINNILQREKSQLYFEVGPHPVLGGSVAQLLTESNKTGVVLSSLRRKEAESELFEKSISDLFINGFNVDWSLTQQSANKRLSLPPYPWQRNLYRSESPQTLNWLQGGNENTLLGIRQPSSNPTWELEISDAELNYLFDHKVQGEAVFPAAGYVEMALQAAQSLHDTLRFSVNDLKLKKALFISKVNPVTVQISLTSDLSQFDIYSRTLVTDNWQHHAKGRLALSNPTHNETSVPNITSDATYSEHSKVDTFSQFETMGFNYGESFQLIQSIAKKDGYAIATIEVPEDTQDFIVHPSILDAGLQALLIAGGHESTTFLPTQIGLVTKLASLEGSLTICTRLTTNTSDSLIGDVSFFGMDGQPVLELLNVQASTIESKNNHGNESTWFQHIQWSESPKSNTDLKDKGDWIVFSDNSQLGQDVSNVIFENGNKVSLLTCADEFNKITGGVPVNNIEAFKAVLEASPDAKNILWLWPLNSTKGVDFDIQDIERSHELGVYSLLSLLKAIDATHRQIHVWPVTRGMHAIESNPSVNVPIELSQAHLSGFSRVMANQERPKIWHNIIDLDHEPMKDEALTLATEILSTGVNEEIAFRNGKRFVGKLQAHTQPANPLIPVFNSQDSYLITGGLGDLGVLYAKHLIKHGAQHIILHVRTAIPARENWEEIDSTTRIGRQVQKLQTLEALGATVQVVTPDITKTDELLEMAANHVANGYPPIRHVIHCAGIVRDKLVSDMTQEDIDAIYNAKIYGSWALHKAFEEQLESFVLFSSYASIFGAIGQSNYASANSFMDALAHFRRQQGLPALSISFGPWTGLGMAQELELDEFFEKAGINPITASNGEKIFNYLYRFDSANVVIAPIDWTYSDTLFPLGVPALMSNLLPQADEDSDNAVEKIDFSEALKTTQGDARTLLITGFLKEQLSLTTKIDIESLDEKVGILDLGLDSLLSTAFKNKIEAEMPVTVPLVDLLKGPSIEKLALQLEEALS